MLMLSIKGTVCVRYDLVKYEESQGRALSVWLPVTTKESTDFELSDKSKKSVFQSVTENMSERGGKTGDFSANVPIWQKVNRPK